MEKILEKLIVTQLVKKSPSSYEIQWFITMYTRASHLILSKEFIQGSVQHFITCTIFVMEGC